MNRISRYSLLAAAVLCTGQAAAQSDEPEGAERAAAERNREMSMREEEFAQRMREAEERLAEAAKQVAELSSKRLETFGDSGNYAIEIMGKPRIGINIEGDEDDGPVQGVEVISVTPGSAADDAGLRSGDVISAVNGESMSAASSKAANHLLLDFMKGVEEGDELAVKYLRDGSERTVSLKPRRIDQNVFVWAQDGQKFTMPRMPEVHIAPEVVERFRYGFGGWRSGWGDMEVVELTAGLGRYFGTDTGLLVISAPKTNDFKLQEGDVIESIDGRAPTSVDHCMRILASYQPGETLELKIMRDKRRETIKIEIPASRSSERRPPPGPLPVMPASAPMPAAAPAPEPNAADRT